MPDTHYAKSGSVHLAYQTVGTGCIDLVLIPGLWTHVDHQWEEPSFARFLKRLASFARLIILDARGAGLSDRAPELPPMEEQMDDVLAVLDVVGLESAAFFALSQAGPMAMLFAASHPQRTSGLILYGTYASAAAREGYPWGHSSDWLADFDRRIDELWGPGVFLAEVAPSRLDDPAFRQWWGRYERLSYGPGNALAYFHQNAETDVRPILEIMRVNHGAARGAFMTIPQQPPDPEIPGRPDPGIEIPSDSPPNPEPAPDEYPSIDDPGYRAPGPDEPAIDLPTEGRPRWD